MRFGLIGYGAWGSHHAAAIGKTPGAILAALACRTDPTAAAAQRDHPGVPVYRDYRDLVRRPDVDAVDIVVPNDPHAEIGVAALRTARKRVVVCLAAERSLREGREIPLAF